jgi:hypothetical protein
MRRGGREEDKEKGKKDKNKNADRWALHRIFCFIVPI